MVEDIKLLLGLSSSDHTKDQLLNILIAQCTEEARNYCHRVDIAPLASVIRQMVIFNYNRIGTEGVDSEDYSGVSFTYSSDYPENILRQLRSHRKLRA